MVDEPEDPQLRLKALARWLQKGGSATAFERHWPELRDQLLTDFRAFDEQVLDLALLRDPVTVLVLVVIRLELGFGGLPANCLRKSR